MADQKLSPPCSPAKSEMTVRAGSIKRAALYTRISTGDQHAETQLYDLRDLAKQRRYEIVHEYTDTICGAKSKRPGLDQLLADARRHRFDVVVTAAFDRVARNVRHFLEVLDELNHLNIEFVSLRDKLFVAFGPHEKHCSTTCKLEAGRKRKREWFRKNLARTTKGERG
jgi:predicted site-specific integrase-resolvase